MITGLELNQRAVLEAQDSGLNVVNETIEKHAIDNRNKYHLVCSFQVVEHIIDIKSFMDSQVMTLKEGGKLIICVPNNNSFIKWEQNHLLNMPPHHMTLWNEISLHKLAVEYPLKVENVVYEPLQSYHFDWFRSLFIERYFSSGIRKKIFSALKLNYFLKKIIPLASPFIKGHSIFVVYKKY
jgi:SAM-dependent methyltransferase